MREHSEWVTDTIINPALESLPEGKYKEYLKEHIDEYVDWHLEGEHDQVPIEAFFIDTEVYDPKDFPRREA